MYFTIDRTKQYLEVIKSTIDTSCVEITDIEYCEGKAEPREWSKFDQRQWGGYDSWAWFRTVFEMPESLKGKTVILKLITGPGNEWNAVNPQFVVYVNGKAAQAFDTNHTFLYLSENAEPGEKFEIIYRGYSGRENKMMNFAPKLYAHSYETKRLYFNLKTAQIAAEMYPKGNEYRIAIENYLTETLNRIDLRIPMSEEYFKSVDAANEYIESEFYGKYCRTDGAPIVDCIGHTHIDVAWLWTVEQTRQKAVRTFSTMLMLMDRYPDFKFMSSQPQLYKFVKEDAPEVYERIKKRVAEGRWEPEGAMWLEADCNLTSGESLIRQILHGKRFFKEEFDKDSKILWLPDVFGYSAALPQILKKSGIDTFVTSKISWNEYNAIPYETFTWQGIDGTEIFTQFILGAEENVRLGDTDNHYSSYNARIIPNSLAFSWEHYHQKNINNEILTSYGYGDGGGGVTEEMLEFEKRTAHGIPGTPVTRLTTATDCINSIKENVKGKNLPKWVGELYLELHRGTYTSMAKNKRFNRICEFLLQHTETVSLINERLLGGSYPKEELYSAWENVLLNQFHDIIPGSSIKDVYDVTDKEYTALIEKNTHLSDSALLSIADNTSKKGILVYNPTSFERSEAVKFGDKYVYAENIPAYGWRVIDDVCETDSDISVSKSHLENRFFAIDIDECGNITRIFDKENSREVIKPGERANVLQAFDDHPKAYDNWEITLYYRESMWEVNDVVSIDVAEVTPLFASVKIVKRFLNSTITQTVTIYRANARIDFKTDIDWHEHHILLKAAFPVDILADKASYEIQYGAIERPTHTNTSWDAAKFEVCAHKWADLSESGYGAALLNDCKYGHDIHDGVMRLTLLKCGTHPNPEADIGHHTFTYSFMPHSGTWREGHVVKEAFALNCPLKAYAASGNGALPSEYSFIASGCENVVISAVKKACDGDDIIVRVYEAFGRRTNAVIKTGFDINKVYESSFIENENFCSVPAEKKSFAFTVKPFEIKTFRIK